MKKLLIFLLFLILFVSCNNSGQKQQLTGEIKKMSFPVTINFEEARTNQEIRFLSDFSDDVSYIKLKTPSNVIIKSIRDIQISNSKIYIHEGLSQKVMIFNMEGDFIKQIGSIGRGPNEYIHLRSFCLDNNEDLILYTGDFGDVFKINSRGVIIEKLFSSYFSDYMYRLYNHLVFSGFGVLDVRNLPDDINQFSITNMFGKVIDSVQLPIYSITNWRKTKVNFPGNFRSTKFDNVLLIYGWGEDTLFHVSESGKIEPRYTLNFGNYNNPIETRYNLGSPEKNNSYIMAISPPFESKRNLWWKFALNGDAFLLRYDKIQQKAFTFFYKGDKKIDFARGRNSMDELGLINDLDGGLDFFPEFAVYDDSTQLFISAKESYDLKNELTQEYFKNREIKFPDKKNNLFELVNSLNEKDDYVLMVVKLK